MARKQGSPNTPESRIRGGAELRRCLICGSEFWVPRWQLRGTRGEGKYCSRPCKHEALRRQPKKPRNQGVSRHSAGYLLEWAPDHPRASRGRVLQHILVAERKLGRSLKPGEEVHHINGIRDDNRLENLEVLSPREHRARHLDREALRERALKQNVGRDVKTGRFRKGG